MAFPDVVPVLTSGDVTLRAHRKDDVAAMVEQCVDPESVRWTTVPLDYTAETARAFIADNIAGGWRTGNEYTFAIESTHPDGRRRFSGTLSLRDEGSRRAELAFGAHPAVRGNGVMTTAVNLLLDWGFAERDLETVIWWAAQGNWASRRVAWKTGFAFGGTVRRWLDHRGEYPDCWVGSLHRDDPRQPRTTWLSAPRIVGDHVVLRPLRDRDVDRVTEGSADARTQHWLGFLPRPYTRADGEAFVAQVGEEMAAGRQLQWAVADPTTDRLLAMVGFSRLVRGNAEIGYWTHPDARGRGAMSGAVSLAVRHAFLPAGDGGLGLRRLLIKAAAGNTASQRVAQANGFTQYGRESASELLGDDSYDDLVEFELLLPTWETRQTGGT